MPRLRSSATQPADAPADHDCDGGGAADDARHVRAVLVVEGDANLVGIFTERDAISRVLAAGRDPLTTTLADVMTNNPETISPQHTAPEMLRLMKEARVRHLPVVRDGKTVGIVVRNDFPE